MHLASMGSIAVHRYGNERGRPLLVLHPLACSGEIWASAGHLVAPAGRAIVAPDLPGRLPDEVRSLSIAQLAAAAADVVGQLGPEPVDVVGMSMGGCVALHLAIEYPQLVRSLTLADTTSDYGQNRVGAWEERAVMAEQSSREELLDFQLSRWFSDAFLAANPAECARVARIFTATSPSAHAACCRALGAFDVTGRLGAVRAPTLVLVGEEDYATPPAMARTLAAGIDGATLRVLEHVRHFSLIESTIAWDLIVAHAA